MYVYRNAASLSFNRVCLLHLHLDRDLFSPYIKAVHYSTMDMRTGDITSNSSVVSAEDKELFSKIIDVVGLSYLVLTTVKKAPETLSRVTPEAMYLPARFELLPDMNIKTPPSLYTEDVAELSITLDRLLSSTYEDFTLLQL